jgi:hypothetical protein
VVEPTFIILFRNVHVSGRLIGVVDFKNDADLDLDIQNLDGTLFKNQPDCYLRVTDGSDHMNTQYYSCKTSVHRLAFLTRSRVTALTLPLALQT